MTVNRTVMVIKGLVTNRCFLARILGVVIVMSSCYGCFRPLIVTICEFHDLKN